MENNEISIQKWQHKLPEAKDAVALLPKNGIVYVIKIILHLNTSANNQKRQVHDGSHAYVRGQGNGTYRDF